jgi:hypothetical protein
LLGENLTGISRDWRTILRFAVLGLAIAAIFSGFSEMDPAPGSFVALVLGVATLLLCPPSLLTFPLIDVDVGTGGFYVVLMVVALLNAALYAAIGSAYVKIRKKREGEATN